MKEIVSVNFSGGGMAIYIDGLLTFYVRSILNYGNVIDYLLENIHLDFKPIQIIAVSDYSTFWEHEPDHQKPTWRPDLLLDDLKKKLDMTHDVIINHSLF